MSVKTIQVLTRICTLRRFACFFLACLVVLLVLWATGSLAFTVTITLLSTLRIFQLVFYFYSQKIGCNSSFKKITSQMFDCDSVLLWPHFGCQTSFLSLLYCRCKSMHTSWVQMSFCKNKSIWYIFWINFSMLIEYVIQFSTSVNIQIDLGK